MLKRLKEIAEKHFQIKAKIISTQGDSLSSILFYTYLEEAISRLPDQLGGKELI